VNIAWKSFSVLHAQEIIHLKQISKETFTEFYGDISGQSESVSSKI
jgi:hypothetical protein